jgi:NAD(P)-dependent dehydrogenase (short-subunit alcohol dehydrogenase family)
MNDTQSPGFADGTFVIIGGAGGIGSEIGRGIVARGGSLVLTSRDASRAEQTAGELGADDHAALDATDFQAVHDLLKRLAGEGHRLLGVVNCAGSILVKPAHMTSPEEVRETFETNVMTAFATVAAAGKVMKDGGSVLLFGTAAAEAGIPNHEAIAAAKAGVAGLARSAAATYAARNLRVNVIAPGLVDTPLAERITGNDRALEASRKMHALERIGTPTDIAPVALALLDPASSWITGQTICVDGGLAGVKARVSG